MLDPRGVAGVKKSCVHLPYRYWSEDLKFRTMSFSFGDVYIVMTGGSNYE
jgi:hypothetical protein